MQTTSRRARRLLSQGLFVALALGIGAAGAACGGAKDEPYSTPQNQRYNGQKQAKIPDPPALPQTPTASPDKSYFTVYGATHHFRSGFEGHWKLYKEVTEKPISILGFVVKTNYEVAGSCAHKENKEDPKDCKENPPPPPIFWIADNKGDTSSSTIQIINWAHNWSAVYDAMDEYAHQKEPKPFKDKGTDADMPNPLPAVGAQVLVTGKYGPFGTNGTSGEKIGDPRNGVMMLEKMETKQPAPEKAAFPGAPPPPKKT